MRSADDHWILLSDSHAWRVENGFGAVKIGTYFAPPKKLPAES
jgi:hypothetical protein